MKKTLVVSLLLLLLAIPVFAAPFLACDLPETGVTITQTKVEITTNPGASQTIQEVTGLTTIQGTEYLLLDLATIANGKYSFRARWAEAGGWWSDYSLPFAVQKTGRPGNIHIK